MMFIINPQMKEKESMSAPKLPTLTGRAYEYEVGNYHLHIVFQGDNRLHWTYLKAPDGQAGKNALEHLDVLVPIRENVLLMEWKEESGTQVIDVLDLEKMMIYCSFVTADGERFFVQAKVKRCK